ncbi:MAG: hypothetical protein K6G08_06965 [Prevotella sp.]|nr:hypothetical protein [Prevotella sp.]
MLRYPTTETQRHEAFIWHRENSVPLYLCGEFIPSCFLIITYNQLKLILDARGMDVTFTTGLPNITAPYTRQLSLEMERNDRTYTYDTTGIDETANTANGESIWYNLQGISMGTKKPQTPGVYLHNGKKIIVGGGAKRNGRSE